MDRFMHGWMDGWLDGLMGEYEALLGWGWHEKARLLGEELVRLPLCSRKPTWTSLVSKPRLLVDRPTSNSRRNEFYMLVEMFRVLKPPVLYTLVYEKVLKPAVGVQLDWAGWGQETEHCGVPACSFRNRVISCLYRISDETLISLRYRSLVIISMRKNLLDLLRSSKKTFW